MIRNFNHAMSSGISIGTGAGSDVRGETWSGGVGGQSSQHLGELLRTLVVVAGLSLLRTIRTFNFFN